MIDMIYVENGENKFISSLFVNTLNTYYAVILITTGIVHRIKRAPSYRCKRDRERERDVRRQLSADARAFHFSGSSSSADGEDAEGDSLPYHRKSLGERLYPRVHALQPVSSAVHSFKMLENIQIRPTCLHPGCPQFRS